MTDNQKKMLTEWMGECWHEWNPKVQNGETSEGQPYCLKCDYQGTYGFRRTFDTWADLGACMEKLAEKGEWIDFFDEIYTSWWATNLTHSPAEDFTSWLFRPKVDGKPHFCKLVAEWMEVKG